MKLHYIKILLGLICVITSITQTYIGTIPDGSPINTWTGGFIVGLSVLLIYGRE